MTGVLSYKPHEDRRTGITSHDDTSRVGVIQHQAKKCKDCHQKLGRSSDRFPNWFQRAHGPLSTLISGFSPPELWDDTFLWFKPPSLWYFVVAALGNYCSPSHIKYWKEGIVPFFSLLLLFSHSVVSNSLWPHGLQHTTLPCPSLSPEFAQTHVHWVENAIQHSSSSVASFSSWPQSSPASGSFPMSRLFASGGQSTGASTSASVFPINIQGYLPLGWTSSISAVQGALKSLIQHHSSKASILWHSAVSHPYMTIGKTIALNIWTFIGLFYLPGSNADILIWVVWGISWHQNYTLKDSFFNTTFLQSHSSAFQTWMISQPTGEIIQHIHTFPIHLSILDTADPRWAQKLAVSTGTLDSFDEVVYGPPLEKSWPTHLTLVYY